MSDRSDVVPFHAGSTWNAVSDGVWRSEVTPDWTQGRTAFGGYIVGGAIRALEAWLGPNRRARSVSSALMHSITPGPFEARATVLREGRNVTVVQVHVHQRDALCSAILATFVTARESSLYVPGDPPHFDVPAPDTLNEIPYVPEMMPPCSQHFKCRWTEGQPPYSGAAASTVSGWIRMPDGGDDPVPAAVAMMDAYPFPMMQMLEQHAPVTSITWSVHLLDLANADPAAWWWLSSKTVHTADGYATFATRLYRPDGKLGAWAEQLVGIYG